MAHRVWQAYRGTTAQVDAVTPAVGELIWETNGLKLAVGDGSTAGGKHVMMGDTSDYIAKSLYDAYSILMATSDNTPIALTVGEQTLVGRKTSGIIAALSGADALLAMGITPLVAELNYVDGVTSAIQGQIDAKSPIASPTFTGTVTLPTGGLTAAPLKFVSGVVLTTPVAGTMEFVSDALSFTITTGVARKTIAFLESPSFTTPALGSATGVALQLSGLTASEILGTDSSKNLASLAVATYPSLTELSYVKGLSSAIQSQLDAKVAKSLFDADTFLYASADDTPVATTPANVLAALSEHAAASFDWNTQALINTKALYGAVDFGLNLNGGPTSQYGERFYVRNNANTAYVYALSIWGAADDIPVITFQSSAIVVNLKATSPTLVTPILGVASATSLATSAAIPLLLTYGQLVNISLTSQTIGATTLTIPNFASVSDTFVFATLAQELSAKTLNASIAKGTWTASGTWTIPAVTLNGTVTLNGKIFDAGSGIAEIDTTGALALLLKTTSEGTIGAQIYGRHVSTSPAVNDVLFTLSADGYDLDTPQNLINYGAFKFLVEDATADAADGKFQIYLLSGQVANLALTTSSLGALWTDLSVDTLTYKVSGTQVVGARVIDARCDDTLASGDATTDGVIDALRDAMITHGLIAAA